MRMRGRRAVEHLPAEGAVLTVDGVHWLTMVWLPLMLLVSVWQHRPFGILLAVLGAGFCMERDVLRLSAGSVVVQRGIRSVRVRRSDVAGVSLRRVAGFYWVAAVVTHGGKRIRLLALSFPIVRVNGRLVPTRELRRRVIAWGEAGTAGQPRRSSVSGQPGA